MDRLRVQQVDFKVDTRRPHSRAKLRSKFRHVMAVAAGMFPTMGVFVFLMSLFRLPVERPPYYHLSLIFFGCGMASLLLYSFARVEKHRRHEESKRLRELKHQQQIEFLRREREATRAPKTVPSPDGGN
ncbi:MAG: hypothetical protein LBN38_02980 [Verrucomicrobiota bacterium]|jgi:Na+/melibiose symporter-like transporter|nr:hypothetical protein [Verrucomicrobiota bacterium]